MTDRRRPGRPALDIYGRPSAAVSVRVPPDELAAAERLAIQRRESVQDLIRRGIRRELAILELTPRR